jgi:hypothetical protein
VLLCACAYLRPCVPVVVVAVAAGYNRHTFDAIVSQQDLQETYLPALSVAAPLSLSRPLFLSLMH